MIPPHHRGRASGIKTLLEIIGGALAVFIIGQLMSNYQTNEDSFWLWLSLGFIMLAMVITIAYTMFNVREMRNERREKIIVLDIIKRTFNINLRSNRPFAWFLASRFLVFMAFATIQQFALYYLRDVIRVDDPSSAAATFTIVAVGGMLLAVLPSGYLADRIGRKPIAFSSGIAGAIGIIIILLFPGYNPAIIGAGIIGLAVGAFAATNWALATDLVIPGSEARYLGIANMASAGGAAMARLIGPVIDFFNGIEINLGYQVMLGASMLYFVTGALLVLRVKRPINLEDQAVNPNREPLPKR
jgi:Na+/melibiose symporter-like transporter